MKERERGSITILAIVALVFAGALMFGVARLGHAASDKARAETAADASALAAASVLARGGDSTSASAAASESAANNGARLQHCSCGGAAPTVSVRLGEATGRARAEVRFECIAAADPDDC
jgi:secretion/DNA translocation related TadE-like protein